MSGTATGPHLHFGVYHLNGTGAVDPYGWSGPGADPYPRDLGDLWLSGSPRFAPVQMPSITLAASSQLDTPTAINVAWGSPGNMSFTINVVTQDGVRRAWTTIQGNGSATFHGKPGQSYWFWANATSDLGWSDAAGSPVVHVPSLSHGALTT